MKDICNYCKEEKEIEKFTHPIALNILRSCADCRTKLLIMPTYMAERKLLSKIGCLTIALFIISIIILFPVNLKIGIGGIIFSIILGAISFFGVEYFIRKANKNLGEDDFKSRYIFHGQSKMNKEYKKSILSEYLGNSPAWFDLRKKEILNDNIDISQWQINMNFLIYKYGTIDSSEQKSFNRWVAIFKYENKEMDFEQYLQKRVTPNLLNILDGDLPRILYRNQDRNWFLAAYPDVFAYFYPQPDVRAEDFDAELRRVENHVETTTIDYESMGEYVLTGKGNQTIYLVRTKNFYKNKLHKDFLLYCKTLH